VSLRFAQQTLPKNVSVLPQGKATEPASCPTGRACSGGIAVGAEAPPPLARTFH